MNSIVVFGAFICLIVAASSQETMTPDCELIHKALEDVVSECHPNQPPTDQDKACIKEVFLRHEVLRTMFETCFNKPSDEETRTCFENQVAATECFQIPQQ
ncbi:hypothetical protein CHUAL_004646 [Chamberlinius hualienensis]